MLQSHKKEVAVWFESWVLTTSDGFYVLNVFLMLQFDASERIKIHYSTVKFGACKQAV